MARYRPDGSRAAQIDAFCDLFIKELDREGFAKKIADIEKRSEMTVWDRTIHDSQKYRYRDEKDLEGDLFASLKYINEGQAIRRAIRLFDFASKPDFPHRKMQKMAQNRIEEKGVWMPAGVRLGTLLDIV